MAKVSSGRGLKVLKTLITVGLCSLLIWQGDWPKIWNAITNANPFWIGVVFGGMLIGVAISAYKWQVLLSIHGIHYAFGRLQRFYYTSTFFNNFLPSNIGGDVYRLFQTIRNQPNRAGAVAAILTERLSGIWALIVLGLIGGAWVYHSDSHHPAWMLPVLGVFALIAVAPPLILLISGRTVAWFMKQKWFPRKLHNILAVSGDYRRNFFKTLQIVFISFGFHLFTLSWMLALAYALGESSSLPRIVMGVAISNLAALLPISINGIGLLDGSFIYVMADLGMDFDAALMMMLVIRALLVVLSLIGGWFYLQDRKHGGENDLIVAAQNFADKEQ